VMMSAASASCCNVYLLHLHHPSPPSHSPVTAPLTSSEVLHLRIPKVSSFGGCAAVLGIFNGVENRPGRIRARQKNVGNKLWRGKLVAVVADDDRAADSNGTSSGDREDVTPTAPDCDRKSSLSLCLHQCVCPFPFLQTLNPNSGHFVNTNLLPLIGILFPISSLHMCFLRSQKQKKRRRSCESCGRIRHYQCLLFNGLGLWF
jgi:hypothetical protein